MLTKEEPKREEEPNQELTDLFEDLVAKAQMDRSVDNIARLGKALAVHKNAEVDIKYYRNIYHALLNQYTP